MTDHMTTAEQITDVGTNGCIALMMEINEARSKVFLETNRMRMKIKELAEFKESLKKVKAKPPQCLPDLW